MAVSGVSVPVSRVSAIVAAIWIIAVTAAVPLAFGRNSE
jgi:hypothetical protein